MPRWSGVTNRKITLDGDVRETASEKAGANRGLRLSLEAYSAILLCSAVTVPPIETRLIKRGVDMRVYVRLSPSKRG